LSEQKPKGVAVKFVGGLADGKVCVVPGDEPQETYEYTRGERTEHYRHKARPNDKCPYHVYVPFEAEESQ
jgi:hypothetical protein